MTARFTDTTVVLVVLGKAPPMPAPNACWPKVSEDWLLLERRVKSIDTRTIVRPTSKISFKNLKENIHPMHTSIRRRRGWFCRCWTLRSSMVVEIMAQFIEGLQYIRRLLDLLFDWLLVIMTCPPCDYNEGYALTCCSLALSNLPRGPVNRWNFLFCFWTVNGPGAGSRWPQACNNIVVQQ